MKLFICLLSIITIIYGHGGSYGGGEHGGGGYGGGGYGGGGHGGGEYGGGGYGGSGNGGGGYGGDHSFGHGDSHFGESSNLHHHHEQVEIGHGLHDGHINNHHHDLGHNLNKQYDNGQSGGKVVVVETTREFVSKPEHTVIVEGSRHHTGDNSNVFGSNQQGKVEIGQQEENDLHYSGSGHHDTDSTDSYKTGGNIVVVDTTREFVSKPETTVVVESSRNHTSETFQTHRHTNIHGDDEHTDVGHGNNQQEQVEIGQEEQNYLLHSGSRLQNVGSGSIYSHKPRGNVVVVETTREFVSKPKHTDIVEIPRNHTSEIFETHRHTNIHRDDEHTDVGHGSNQQEQVEIGQEEQNHLLHSGSRLQNVGSGSINSHKPGGNVVVVETTKEFVSNPKHTDIVESSRHHTSETFQTHGQTNIHGDDEHSEVGNGNNQQEQVEIDQEEQTDLLHAGSRHQNVVSGSTYSHKPGGHIVVVETTREFVSKPKHTDIVEIPRNHTSEIFETHRHTNIHEDDEHTEVGHGNNQQEQVEIGQEEQNYLLHSGSRLQNADSGSIYNHKPGGNVVVVETTREFVSKPKHTDIVEIPRNHTSEIFETHRHTNIHEDDEHTDVGHGSNQQEQVEVGQEEQNYLFHSGSRHQNVVSGSINSHKPGGNVVVVETTREFASNPKHTVNIASSRDHTRETILTHGHTNIHGDDVHTEVGHDSNQQEQVEIGQEEQSDLLHSGSRHQNVVSGSTYNQKPGRNVVVVETTREFVSKPRHTVVVESSRHHASETFETHGNTNIHGHHEHTEVGHDNNDEQEHVEVGLNSHAKSTHKKSYNTKG